MTLATDGTGLSLFRITSSSTSAYPYINVILDNTLSVNDLGSTGLSTAVDTPARRFVVTLTDTGAQLTFDFSDVRGTREGESPVLNFGATVPWTFSPIVFRDGIYKETQTRSMMIQSNLLSGTLIVEKGEDGSFTGQFYHTDTSYSVDLRFNEEGRVSGYKFTKNAGSTSDPSVGIEYTGSIVKGIYPYERAKGFINVDLSSVQVICLPDPPEPEAPELEESPEEPEEVIPEEVLEPEAILEKPLEEAIPEETKVGFAPLSPASLSIDENGVLKRLKDNGDWEPVYLLACGQFAAMNAAEERNGVYYATPASGALRTGISGKDGMGTITAGTLERSTTDLAHELSDMIRAQHAYAANTKVLSTLDDMLTELERL
jgi:hypothetical protein